MLFIAVYKLGYSLNSTSCEQYKNSLCPQTISSEVLTVNTSIVSNSSSQLYRIVSTSSSQPYSVVSTFSSQLCTSCLSVSTFPATNSSPVTPGWTVPIEQFPLSSSYTYPVNAMATQLETCPPISSVPQPQEYLIPLTIFLGIALLLTCVCCPMVVCLYFKKDKGVRFVKNC